MSRITAPRGSFGYAQDRLFDSAPSAVPRDKSVRRFAQDDDFVGGLKKNTPNRLTLVGLRPGQARLKPCPSSRDSFLSRLESRVFSRTATAWPRPCPSFKDFPSLKGQ